MQAPDDSWAEYTHVYMSAIRAKFYAAHDKPEAGGKQPAKLEKKGMRVAEDAAGPAALLIREDTAFLSPAHINVTTSSVAA